MIQSEYEIFRLNGTETAYKNIPAGQNFHNEIKKDHIRTNIRKRMDSEEKTVQDLLSKWATAPEEDWLQMLNKENIPVQMEIE